MMVETSPSYPGKQASLSAKWPCFGTELSLQSMSALLGMSSPVARGNCSLPKRTHNSMKPQANAIIGNGHRHLVDNLVSGQEKAEIASTVHSAHVTILQAH